MADSPARETPEEIIRILRCSDEDFANILDKNRQKQCYNINLWFAKILEKTHNAIVLACDFKTFVKVNISLVMFLWLAAKANRKLENMSCRVVYSLQKIGCFI